MEVNRKFCENIVTVSGGGYIASGEHGALKYPEPYLSNGLTYIKHEGPGEVQTPLKVPTSVALSIGDSIFFRHAKAGEICERFKCEFLAERITSA